MKKRLLFLPMMLLLLTGCGGGQEGETGAEALAVAIRGEYMAMTSYSLQAQVNADYGQRVYDFTLSVTSDGEETTVVIREPEMLAGVTARMDGDEGTLECEDLSLETGLLDGESLSPVSALPTLVEAARTQYIDRCTLADGVLEVHCADPEEDAGTGREVTLYFDAQTHALTGGEISQDGRRVITCEITEFTKT
mgnify:FL=1